MKIEVETAKFLQSFKRLQKEMAKAIVDGSQEAGKFLEGKIKASGFPVASNTARQSITTETTVTKNFVLTLVGADAVAYTSVIEEGRRPGTYPNFGGIALWLARKKDIQNSLRDKFTRRSRKTKRVSKPKLITVSGAQRGYKTLDSRQRGLVFLIARGIKENGIDGRFYFKNVREKYAKEPNEIISRRLNDVLKKY